MSQILEDWKDRSERSSKHYLKLFSFFFFKVYRWLKYMNHPIGFVRLSLPAPWPGSKRFMYS